MERLYVLYDERCGLCRWAKEWALAQPAYFPLTFLAAGSEQAIQLFPGLSKAQEPQELVAVSNRGEVYRNDSAWIMCLFALEDYREWANRLATPALRPLARQAFAFVSKQRGNLSRWIGLADDHEITATLREVQAPACEIDPALALERLAALNASKQSLGTHEDERRQFHL